MWMFCYCYFLATETPMSIAEVNAILCFCLPLLQQLLTLGGNLFE